MQIKQILFISEMTKINTKWLECEISQTATFQDSIGYIHGICENSDIQLKSLWYCDITNEWDKIELFRW